MLITICIPAYKRVTTLKRLLDSIAIQTFRDFEVVITDDSPGPEVRQLCMTYQDAFTLRYFQNMPASGTPENWNEGIRRANGKWIKPMHDDDWFAGIDSLARFADAASANPKDRFIFSSFTNVYPDGREKEFVIGGARYLHLLKRPAILFAENVIGPPSCVMFEKKEALLFDNRLKWLVDIEFYIRCLRSIKPLHLPACLVKIGISDTQVTKEAFGNREIEIPESFLLLESMGVHKLSDLLVFDAWWRLLRNLRIRSLQEILQAGFTGVVPDPIRAMIGWQQKFPPRWLKIGVFSKIVMFCCFIFTRQVPEPDSSRT